MKNSDELIIKDVERRLERIRELEESLASLSKRMIDGNRKRLSQTDLVEYDRQMREYLLHAGKEYVYNYHKGGKT